ncbi:MAG: hypothetical protein KBT02_09235 [Treponema sp.]|nr:hypothetical protein [Candidatus Treponema caballi]
MDDREYLEYNLPEFLDESLVAFKKALVDIQNGKRYLQLDMDYCELQSNINVAEVEQLITPEQADYLRGKYLYAE